MATVMHLAAMSCTSASQLESLASSGSAKRMLAFVCSYAAFWLLQCLLSKDPGASFPCWIRARDEKPGGGESMWWEQKHKVRSLILASGSSLLSSPKSSCTT